VLLMDVLLSIKPKYTDKIIEGEKKFEFRKTRLSKEKVDDIYIYSSSPVRKIIGKVTISKILEDRPKKIWEMRHKYSGLTEKNFSAISQRRR
jgi:predicted transcriptional regulator